MDNFAHMNTETEQLDIPALVKERAEILQWLNNAKAREMEIRRQLVSYFFPTLEEGTNNIEKDGYSVKVVHTISRKIDESALDAVMLQMPEEMRNVGVLIGYSPKLIKAGYDSLDEEKRKVFDQALTISEDSAPQLKEIVSLNPTQAAVPVVEPKAAAQMTSFVQSPDTGIAHQTKKKSSAITKSKPSTKKKK